MGLNLDDKSYSRPFLAIPLACQGSSGKGGRSDLPFWIRLSTSRLRWMRETERERRRRRGGYKAENLSNVYNGGYFMRRM